MGILGDTLDFFTGGGETTTSKKGKTATVEQQIKNTTRLDSQSTQLGQVQSGTTDIRRLSLEAESGGLGGISRISSLAPGAELTAPGSNIAELLAANAGENRQRALGIPGEIQGLLDPILAERRRTLQDTLDRDITRRASQAGSRLNSFIDVAAAEGQADLESQLASIEAEAALGGIQQRETGVLAAEGVLSESGSLLRQLGIDEAAIESDVGGTIAALINALKGGTEMQDVLTETQQTENVRSLIEELAAQSGQITTKTSGTGTVDPPRSFSEFAEGFNTFTDSNPFK